MKDVNEVNRGSSFDCGAECPEFMLDEKGPRCGYCGCLPIRHEKIRGRSRQETENVKGFPLKREEEEGCEVCMSSHSVLQLLQCCDHDLLCLFVILSFEIACICHRQMPPLAPADLANSEQVIQIL